MANESVILSKGQLAVLEPMAAGAKLRLHKLDRKASVQDVAVNLLTFHALIEKGLIEIHRRGDVITLWRISPAGLEAVRHGQEKAS